MAIYRGAGGAGDAVADSSTEASLIRALAVEVQADADAAEAARAAAVVAKTAAETAETNAETAETNAETAETNAETAATSATASASTATTQAGIATTQASNASTSATAAAGSASAASTSATNAASSASAASTSATAAAGSASSASTSATSATASATSATNSASTATTQATNASNSATAASTSATNAATSATAAQTAETNAETAETNAATSYTNTLAIYGSTTDVANAVSAASTSASNAATSATNAANSATAAGTSETNASNSASSASTSASTASTAATTATTQATNAAASATSASTSSTTATTKAAEALASANAASASAAAASAVALGDEPIRHSVRPSLLLDFANTKTLDPRITFTRASTGTFYDGKTVAKAEENLLINSEAIDGSGWTRTSSTATANSTTAPDGNTTADTLTASAGTGVVPRVAQGPTVAVADHVASFFVKAGTHSYVQMFSPSSSSGWHANFDLSTGSLGTSSGCTPSIVSVGSGWYRCIVAVTASSNVSAQIALVSSTSGSRFPTWNPVGTETIFLWGAQLEQRSSVTAYTATTTAPITNYIPALQSAASGVARFEHNPVTGESLGLEIEEQRTNLLTYSSEFDNAAWTKTRASITANTIVAPDGTLTGDKIVENTDSNTHLIFASSITYVSGAPYTQTVYMKAGERTFGYLVFPSGQGFSANIGVAVNLTTGETATLGSPTSSSATSVGNGWWRVSVTASPNATSGRSAYIGTADSLTVLDSTAGNGFSGIYIWGAQLEAGAFATSYIPTVASQVTRSADVSVMTGTNFSSWYRADEGTLYAETISPNSFSRTQFSINNDTNDNKIEPSITSTNIYQLAVNLSGSAVGRPESANTTTANSPAKTAGAYKVNDFAASLNGGTVGTDTSGNLPIVDRMFIGQRTAGAVSLNGTIRKIAYYPLRLTNAELVSLTTI